MEKPTIHPVASHGFACASQVYDTGRPAYRLDAVERLRCALDIGQGSVVADLGAGTGKLTKLLRARATRLIAIEPVEAMRQHLVHTVPDVEVLAGSAEDIPLARGSVDAVVAAQSFHWFDGPRALAGIHRVLRPAGLR